MRAVLITHNDLDGVVCAVLFKKVYPDSVYYLEDYNSVDEQILRVLGHPETGEEKPDILYITDITPRSDGLLAALDSYFSFFSNKEIKLFDHHKTAVQRLEPYAWATTGSVCGAQLLYDHFSSVKPFPLAAYYDLVHLTNDYDLWKHEFPNSSTLNSLLGVYGPERFIDRFLENPSVVPTETERLMLEIEDDKQCAYIKDAAKTATYCLQDGGPKIAVVCAERCISQLADYILNTAGPPGIDIVAVINMQKRTVSLRSKHWDVAAVAKAFGGGGHSRAAGFSLKGCVLHDELARVIRALA